MFREMRRKKQALSLAECARILYRGTSGVLALSGDGGYPYAVPMSYVYDGEKLFFHSAGSGHKLDAIRRDPKASFCVIDCDRVVPEAYTTYFRSVIVFGTVRILTAEREKYEAIDKLALKYVPGRRRRASPERHRPRVEKPVLAGADAGASLGESRHRAFEAVPTDRIEAKENPFSPPGLRLICVLGPRYTKRGPFYFVIFRRNLIMWLLLGTTITASFSTR